MAGGGRISSSISFKLLAFAVVSFAISMQFKASFRTALRNTAHYDDNYDTMSQPPANTVIGQKDNYPNASALALTYPTVPRPKPQTIFFLHQSKSGGTSVCKIISQYSDVPMTDVDGKATGPFGQYRESCNVLFKTKDGSWHPISWRAPRYCDDLIPYTMDDQMRAYQRKNWIVVESTWYDEMPCPGYRSFTIMRHPVKSEKIFLFYKLHWYE